MINSTTYILSEMASLLCPEGDERAVYRTARRIQNWVTARLLRPVGGAHSGRGVHRRYDRHELGKAAVFLELHQYQMPAKALELVAGLFDDARELKGDFETKGMRGPSPGQIRKQGEFAKLLRRAWRGRSPVYLTLDLTPASEIRAGFGTNLRLPRGSRSMVVVDLAKILSTLP